MGKEEKDSYKQILKSTSLVGGTQILKIIIGIIRSKIVAVLLGPAGIGLDGIFQTILELFRNATGFGINFSGVKSIAESHNYQDELKIAKTIKVLKRWAIATGVLGVIVLIIFSERVGIYSFGNANQNKNIILISITLFFTSISASQLAILQGLRKIHEMAAATLIGVVVGTMVSLPIYWWLGTKGIPLVIVLNAACSLIVSWFYTKQIKYADVKLSFRETFSIGSEMAKSGFYIVFNALAATAAMYLIRVIILDKAGIASVGYFQAVWVMSTFYINILLTSMLADYFPRLSMLQNDAPAGNKLINEQLEITLLLGTPMVLIMVIFAPFALNLLYSSSFYSAVPVLRWQMAAAFCTLISWPMSVLYLSKSKGKDAMISEMARQIIYIGGIIFGWKYFGFDVLGISFFVANIGHLIYVILSVRRINHFRLTTINILYCCLFGAGVTAVLLSTIFLESFLQYGINGLVLIIISYYCLIKLDKLIGLQNWLRSKKIYL